MITNQTIKEIVVDDNEVVIVMDDHIMRLWDDARYCCEYRKFTCDDDLSYAQGTKFISWEVAKVEHRDDGQEYSGRDDIAFLHIRTSLFTFVVQAHNFHNGYYAGFDIVSKVESRNKY